MHLNYCCFLLQILKFYDWQSNCWPKTGFFHESLINDCRMFGADAIKSDWKKEGWNYCLKSVRINIYPLIWLEMKVFWFFFSVFSFIRNPAETIGKRLTWCVSCHRGWNPWKRYQCKSFSFPWILFFTPIFNLLVSQHMFNIIFFCTCWKNNQID